MMPVPVTTPSVGNDFFLHAEIVAIVLGMKPGFLEGASLEECFDAITSGHHALLTASILLVLTPARPARQHVSFRVLPVIFFVS